MKNRQMNELSVRLTGNQLLDGVQFEEIIEQKDFRKSMTQEESSKLNNDYLISVDEEVWEISVKRNTDPKQPAQMNAKNVTEEYAITRSLIEKQMELEDLSRKLSAYNQKIADTVANQEILHAKARIHDELGIALLTAKRYLSDTEERVTREDEREEVIRLLKENIHVLYEDTPDVTKGDEYELMFRTAEQVLVDGTLPQKEPAKHLTAMAIHECITNTIRHAEGDVIRINAEHENSHRIHLTFTNNGKKPEKEIVPKGGLSSLQELVNQADGRMKIESFPVFKLHPGSMKSIEASHKK